MSQGCFGLQNQVAVVTGASSGIGRAIALALAAQGAGVCLAARRQGALEAVAAEVRAASGRAAVQCTDLSRDEDLRELVERVRQDFGRLDVLVLCGGAIFHGKLEEASLDEFDLQYRCNLRAHYALVRMMLPLLRQQKGQIVFVNSSAGLRSPAGAGQHAAMQHALRAVADSLRDEVNADGIRVLSIYPGRTATPRTERLFQEEERTYRPELLIQPTDIAAMVTAALILPRTAEVTDISIRPLVKSY